MKTVVLVKERHLTVTNSQRVERDYVRAIFTKTEDAIRYIEKAEKLNDRKSITYSHEEWEVDSMVVE